MKIDDFLANLPACDKCHEIFPPGGDPTDLVGIDLARHVDGRRQVVQSRLYHVACAPRRSDGSSYPAGSITFVVVGWLKGLEPSTTGITIQGSTN
jgi:hypothetical protein